MISAGNDIVSLAHIDRLRSQDARYYGKILCPEELQLYNGGEVAEIPFEIFVWLAWSIKEAAFKFWKRQMPGLVFSPLKISIQSVRHPEDYVVGNLGCKQLESRSFDSSIAYQSVVYNGSSFLYSRSVIFSELIYSVVDDSESFDSVWWGIKTLESSDPASQSAGVRSFISGKLQEVFPRVNINIQKSAHGYPILFNERKEMNIPVSFTHHQYYAGYSFLLSNTLSVGQTERPQGEIIGILQAGPPGFKQKHRSGNIVCFGSD